MAKANSKTSQAAPAPEEVQLEVTQEVEVDPATVTFDAEHAPASEVVVATVDNNTPDASIQSAPTGVTPPVEVVVEPVVVPPVVETPPVVEPVITTPPVVEVAPEVVPVVAPPVPEIAPVVATPVAPIEVVPHHIAFFEQYIANLKNKKPEQAIKSFNNCIKSMLATNNGEAFNQVYSIFKTHKNFLKPKVVLQAVATLPSNERAALEVVSTIFHVLIEDISKGSINLDVARSVVKNEAFINWCAKQLTK